MVNRNAHTLKMAELAMGSSFRIMQDWQLQRGMGWHTH